MQSGDGGAACELTIVMVMMTVFFEEFLMEFTHLRSRLVQCFLAGFGRKVNFAASAFDLHFFRSQPSSLFKAVQQGIHGSWADLVAMSPKLLDHAQAKYSFGVRMMKDVYANETREDLSVPGRSFRSRQFCRSSRSSTDHLTVWPELYRTAG
jgi:hypothetical protein